VEYRVVPGPFSEYLALENPLDGKLSLLKENGIRKMAIFIVKMYRNVTVTILCWCRQMVPNGSVYSSIIVRV
jgi:hypothetical protein